MPLLLSKNSAQKFLPGGVMCYHTGDKDIPGNSERRSPRLGFAMAASIPQKKYGMATNKIYSPTHLIVRVCERGKRDIECPEVKNSSRFIHVGKFALQHLGQTLTKPALVWGAGGVRDSSAFDVLKCRWRPVRSCPIDKGGETRRQCQYQQGGQGGNAIGGMPR